ncbi:hypothetical protein [Microbacterium meiriae (nom. nud.)]|uniref:hypothetical protein n=1 Tax=Microbacterium meiriae (nom. nud.) TaxID=3041512 RepID=UPI0028F0A1AF|nr:hypothetical protein [Microbacterium sp. F6_8S_P_2B]
MPDERAGEVEFGLTTGLPHPLRTELHGHAAEQRLRLGRQARVAEHLGAVEVADGGGQGAGGRERRPGRGHQAQRRHEVPAEQRGIAEVVRGLGEGVPFVVRLVDPDRTSEVGHAGVQLMALHPHHRPVHQTVREGRRLGTGSGEGVDRGGQARLGLLHPSAVHAEGAELPAEEGDRLGLQSVPGQGLPAQRLRRRGLTGLREHIRRRAVDPRAEVDVVRAGGGFLQLPPGAGELPGVGRLDAASVQRARGQGHPSRMPCRGGRAEG